MFYFLIIIGIVLIVGGLYLNKKFGQALNRKDKVADSRSYREVEKLYILEKRVGELEKIFALGEDLDRKDEILLIEKYQEEGYSFDEIANFLDMSKGEVLLLEKLKKNYQE